MWDEEWSEFKGTSFFGRFLRIAQRRAFKKIFSKINIDRNSKVIDVGCGSGTTLYFLKKYGFVNSIGIDSSPQSLNICKEFFGLENGRDIFLMDAAKTNFRSEQFELVFSDGLLEHFKNPIPIIKEKCRISKKWILLFQPNHSSLINKIKQMLSIFVIRFYKKGRIYLEALTWQSEFDYTKDDYNKWFKKFGFNLVDCGGLNFNESMWLLFQRSET
jgi:cyclopropane fatty-acyl-phospholipid synthase-like methyltransferase